MKHYIILEDNKIKYNVTCPENEVLLYGDNYIEHNGFIDPSTHYYKDGLFLELPEKPLGNLEFNPDTEQWEGIGTTEERKSEVSNIIRSKRTQLLRDSDWTQFPDSPLTEEQKTAWQVYRQSLRDMPEQYATETNIENVVFPTSP